MQTKNNNKIIVILGPTSSGKTGLGVKLAYKFNGEIVSADSRQVYRGMDVGTGKDLEEYEIKHKNTKTQKQEVIKIHYHLIDVVSPKTKFSLVKYQRLAYKAIDDILARGKLPIIVGGTGLYLQAIVDGYELGKVKPDKKLREKLEKSDADKLFKKLQKLNPGFANRLHESDKKNKRRLIRYIEICETQIVTNYKQIATNKTGYDFLLIGLTWPREVLCERIYKRLIKRLKKEDMVGEVEQLHKRGVSWKRLESFGLEYKYIALYLQRKLSYKEMVEKLNIASRQFAKRQMSWFRRWERQSFAKATDCKHFSEVNAIHWVNPVTSDRVGAKRFNRVKSGGEAEKLVREFKRK